MIKHWALLVAVWLRLMLIAGLARLSVADGNNPAQDKAAIRKDAVDLGATGNASGRIDVAATLL